MPIKLKDLEQKVKKNSIDISFAIITIGLIVSMMLSQIKILRDTDPKDHLFNFLIDFIQKNLKSDSKN